MYPVRMATLAAGCLLLAAPAFAQKEEQTQSPANRPAHLDRGQVVDKFLKTYDKNGDGFIERDEMPAALKKHFDRWDVKNAGKLSREDLLHHAGVLRRFERHEARPESREQRREVRRERHEQHRKNGQHTGILMSPEVLGVVLRVATSDEPARTGVQMVYELLQNIDKNKDGTIDHAEWQAALDQVREFRVNNIMQRQGQDGRISRKDARGVVRWNFDAWDLNKDGFIDHNELRQGFNLKPKQEEVTTETDED